MITWKSVVPAIYGDWTADIKITIENIKEFNYVFYIFINSPSSKFDSICIRNSELSEDNSLEILSNILYNKYDNVIENLLLKKIQEITSSINIYAGNISNDKSVDKSWSSEVISEHSKTITSITNFILFLKEKSLSQLQ